MAQYIINFKFLKYIDTKQIITKWYSQTSLFPITETDCFENSELNEICFVFKQKRQII